MQSTARSAARHARTKIGTDRVPDGHDGRARTTELVGQIRLRKRTNARRVEEPQLVFSAKSTGPLPATMAPADTALNAATIPTLYAEINTYAQTPTYSNSGTAIARHIAFGLGADCTTAQVLLADDAAPLKAMLAAVRQHATDAYSDVAMVTMQALTRAITPSTSETAASVTRVAEAAVAAGAMALMGEILAATAAVPTLLTHFALRYCEELIYTDLRYCTTLLDTGLVPLVAAVAARLDSEPPIVTQCFMVLDAATKCHYRHMDTAPASQVVELCAARLCKTTPMCAPGELAALPDAAACAALRSLARICTSDMSFEFIEYLTAQPELLRSLTPHAFSGSDERTEAALWLCYTLGYGSPEHLLRLDNAGVRSIALQHLAAPQRGVVTNAAKTLHNLMFAPPQRALSVFTEAIDPLLRIAAANTTHQAAAAAAVNAVYGGIKTLMEYCLEQSHSQEAAETGAAVLRLLRKSERDLAFAQMSTLIVTPEDVMAMCYEALSLLKQYSTFTIADRGDALALLQTLLSQELYDRLSNYLLAETDALSSDCIDEIALLLELYDRTRPPPDDVAAPAPPGGLPFLLIQ